MNRAVVLFVTIVSSSLLVEGGDNSKNIFANSFKACNEKFNVKIPSTINDFSSLIHEIIGHPNEFKCYADCILKELHFLTDAGFNENSVTAAVGFYGTISEKIKCKIPVDALEKCFDTAGAVATSDPTDKECARTGALVKCMETNFNC